MIITDNIKYRGYDLKRKSNGHCEIWSGRDLVTTEQTIDEAKRQIDDILEYTP